MDLKDFISETLIAVIEGIQVANKKINREGNYPILYQPGKHSSDNFNTTEKIGFEVFLQVEDQTDKKGGGQVNVVGIKIGGEGKASQSELHSHKITFSVPFDLTNANPS